MYSINHTTHQYCDDYLLGSYKWTLAIKFFSTIFFFSFSKLVAPTSKLISTIYKFLKDWEEIKPSTLLIGFPRKKSSVKPFNWSMLPTLLISQSFALNSLNLGKFAPLLVNQFKSSILEQQISNSSSFGNMGSFILVISVLFKYNPFSWGYSLNVRQLNSVNGLLLK